MYIKLKDKVKVVIALLIAFIVLLIYPVVNAYSTSQNQLDKKQLNQLTSCSKTTSGDVNTMSY